MRVILIVAFLMGLAFSASAAKLLCEPKDKFAFEGGKSKTTPAKVWVLIDDAKRTMSRCDSAGCDAYPYSVHSSGIFTIYSGNPGHFVKITGDQYVEVATAGLTVFVSQGKCSPR